MTSPLLPTTACRHVVDTGRPMSTTDRDVSPTPSCCKAKYTCEMVSKIGRAGQSGQMVKRKMKCGCNERHGNRSTRYGATRKVHAAASLSYRDRFMSRPSVRRAFDLDWRPRSASVMVKPIVIRSRTCARAGWMGKFALRQ